jgi:hypothetical protein
MTKRVALHRLRTISKRRTILLADDRRELGEGSAQVIEWPIKAVDRAE